MVVVFRLNKRISWMKIFFVLLSVVVVYLLKKLINEHIQLHSIAKSCNGIEPVDVVYTWVNGSDPRFIKNLNEYLGKRNRSVDSSKQRFDDKYELKFSLRSLEKYAPWINHVFIVTNGQIPYWLNLDYEKVSIITHEQIFEDSFNLPTFSSPAIESNLHKIPGLSNKFIYFNDDLFLGAPTYLEDFFSLNRGYLIYLAWPVPMCAPNCPWLYVHDQQCDKACLNLNCQMDGGDCDNYEEKQEQSSKDELIKHIFMMPATNISNLLNIHNNETRNLSQIVSNYNRQTILKTKDKGIWRKQKMEKYNQKKKISHNFDAFSASLQHSNRVFNIRYGFKKRRVPSHAPIFLQKDILFDLQRTFSKEFLATERNRVRSSDDMQFSFSYYYFLMSQIHYNNVDNIFDIFDTDKSGTWSDREMRTLLTKLYELPLSYAIVDHFENMILNCSERLNLNDDIVTPEYERYMDSRLNVITKELVVNCKKISEILVSRFGQTPKYKYEEIINAENKYVSFKMLNSNISDVVSQLDDVRSSLKKFICLNDNLDDSKTTENELIHSILYDFYLSLFPHASQFELPKNYQNKFLYMEDLVLWKNHNYNIKLLVYALSFVVLYLTFFGLVKRKLRQFTNKLYFC